MEEHVSELDQEVTAVVSQESGLQSRMIVISLKAELLAAWAQFRTDVLSDRRVVQPLAGWLLSGLLGLVVWLTAYARGAFERAKLGHGADPDGVITVEAGYATVIIVALIAFAVAFEPFVSQVIDARRNLLRKSLGRSHSFVRLPVTAIVASIGFIWRLPSRILSLVDYILARPIASLAGVTQEGWVRRYAWGGFLMFGSTVAGLYASAPWGLIATVVGLVAILSIVRRWSWSEADRETFLVERGIREGAMRVGFKEDLRDEALVAIIFMFVLIPIGLRQIQLTTCAAGACAFAIEGGATLPLDVLGEFVIWLGYFGAELAKSVPFVDWSEVFHVANDSPIEPQTPLGAQIVFAMRATLDLLLLAAVLQAVQIAGRLRDQWTAFGANRLPILEPHTEQRLLNITFDAIEPCLEQHPTRQHAIVSFPAYAAERLKEVIRDRTGKSTTEVRKVAAALLACQHVGDATDGFFAEQERTENDADVRDWFVHVASGVTRERYENYHEADREQITVLLEDRFEAIAVRSAAARRLARMPHSLSTTALLQERLTDSGERVEVRAAAALALSRHEPKSVRSDIEKLANSFSANLSVDDILAAMATAHALARCAPDINAQSVGGTFVASIRDRAIAAARIQTEPMDVDEARVAEATWVSSHHLVRIVPGEGLFKREFTVGSRESDEWAEPAEKPAKTISMTRPYAIGRYAVTREEYLIFDLARGFGPLRDTLNGRLPIVDVSWRDAIEYCRLLEVVTGELYRLPHEVEWEYACRAGTQTRWSWGDEWDDSKASTAETRNAKSTLGPVEVASYVPNNWGLWQMHGNVLEWCCDAWHDNQMGRPEGQGMWCEGGSYDHRVVRGGSWAYQQPYVHSAYRHKFAVGRRGNNVGFRLAKTIRA